LLVNHFSHPHFKLSSLPLFYYFVLFYFSDPFFHSIIMRVHLSSLNPHSLGSVFLKLLSSWVERTHPFAARVVARVVLLQPSGGHNCLTRCLPQMFLKPQVCVEYGNRTREHHSGHQSSYWLWTSVLNFSDLTLSTHVDLTVLFLFQKTGTFDHNLIY